MFQSLELIVEQDSFNQTSLLHLTLYNSLSVPNTYFSTLPIKRLYDLIVAKSDVKPTSLRVFKYVRGSNIIGTLKTKVNKQLLGSFGPRATPRTYLLSTGKLQLLPKKCIKDPHSTRKNLVEPLTRPKGYKD